MDRSQLTALLEQSDHHVRLAEEHIARQVEWIARLENLALDTQDAQHLLSEFQELLAVHIAHRDRLRDRLADRFWW